MSLFRAREWWSTKLGEGEEFDKGSMALGNVDNNSGGGVKVVTGSFQGMLRVHHLKQAEFRIEDLLLEQDLGAPILQVSVGRFIPAAPGMKAIAVLHPRKLGVYTLEAVGGRGPNASYYNLVKAYEHALGVEGGGHFTSCNMTHGGFGGVSRDLLCVQSMDGRVQVFEQDAHAFTRRLNGILAPGPICYVAKIDAFVVGNSELGVDCYKYQALAASQSDREEGKSKGISGARGLQAYWSCQLGESALELFVAKFSRALGPGCVDIVVVGERTLFTLREQGTVRLQKILGYQPACACKYTLVAAPGDDGARVVGTTVHEIDDEFAAIVEEENLIIAAGTDQLMVYKDLQLVWQATVSRAPVCVAVATLGTISGMVCSLDDEGVLTACYQGTDPPTSAVVAAEAKEVDYDQINKEHRELLQVIRRSQIDSARPRADKLTLQVQVPRYLDDCKAQEQRQQQQQQQQQIKQASDDRPGSSFDEDARGNPFEETKPRSPPTAGGGGDPDDPAVVAVTVLFVVKYSGAGEIRGAMLNVSPPPGVSAEPSSALLPPLRGTGSGGEEESPGGNKNNPRVVAVVMKAERGTGRLPSTLLGEASVVYTRPGAGTPDGGGDPMSSRCDLQLPLALAARVVVVAAAAAAAAVADTVGDGAHELTFTTNQAPLSLLTLFEGVTVPPQSTLNDVSNRREAEYPISSGAGGGPAVHGDGGGGRRSDMDSGEGGVADGESAALTFRYWASGAEAGASQDVSIAVSKNSGRYRVQSGSFAALGVMAAELVRRLREHFGELMDRDRSGGASQAQEAKSGRDKDSRLRIEYTESLPLPEFYSVVDEHFERRRDLLRVSENLNSAAHQYRVVEKRLLSRFKDRNPSPLDRLDVVSEQTYSRLVDLGQAVEEVQGRLATSAGELGCAVRLLALLMQCRFQLSFKDHALLLAHLHPDVVDTDDQGWEESVDAAVTHLLRTSLAKVAKDSAPPPASGQPPLAIPEDTAKLKKHVSIVCDRISKGARLALRPAAPPSSPRISVPGSPPAPSLSPRGLSPRGAGRG